MDKGERCLEKSDIVEIKKRLRDFGSTCYWYAEDTGDYDISNLPEDNEEFQNILSFIKNLAMRD